MSSPSRMPYDPAYDSSYSPAGEVKVKGELNEGQDDDYEQQGNDQEEPSHNGDGNDSGHDEVQDMDREDNEDEDEDEDQEDEGENHPAKKRPRGSRSSRSSRSSTKRSDISKRSGSNGHASIKDSEDSVASPDSERHMIEVAGIRIAAKRNHTRTYQTLLTGTKIKHLKKKDGEPLWRADIQYDFLNYIFSDNNKVFTNSYKRTGGHTFADIYIDAMARSSKCSKVLRDKLLGDRRAGLNMAMVCLLVNIGRMNTTLNFFPEMRAQLRTYHPIPSLQTYSDQSDYKQLQDAPRLKSILKGACEDRPEPGTMEEMYQITDKPRTNPINLVFLMSTYAPKVQDRFFHSGYEFFDLIMNKELSSASRGRVFLWLLWSYLETDLSPEQLRTNPFGMGTDDGVKVPKFSKLAPELIRLENVDTEDEIEFGAHMTKERSNYIEASQNATTPQQPSNGAQSGSKSKPSALKRKRGADGRSQTPSKNKGLPDDPDASDDSLHSHSRLKGSPKTARLSSRDAKIHSEIHRIVQNKFRRFRNLRYKQGSIKREWLRMRTDGVTDGTVDSNDGAVTATAEAHNGENLSEDETVKKQLQAKKRSDEEDPFVGMSNWDDSVLHDVDMPGDYGEEASAIARALRRSLRWLNRWKNEDEHIKNEEHNEEQYEQNHPPRHDLPHTPQSNGRSIMSLGSVIDG